MSLIFIINQYTYVGSYLFMFFCVCVTLYWLKSNNEDQFLFLIINILSLGKMIYAKICAEIMPSGKTIFFQVKGRVKSPAATNSHWHLIKLAHSLCSARPFDTIYGTWSRKITMFCQMFLKAKHCWAEWVLCSKFTKWSGENNYLWMGFSPSAMHKYS